MQDGAYRRLFTHHNPNTTSNTTATPNNTELARLKKLMIASQLLPAIPPR
jgi:hypothetical protein